MQNIYRIILINDYSVNLANHYREENTENTSPANIKLNNSQLCKARLMVHTKHEITNSLLLETCMQTSENSERLTSASAK